MKKRFISALLTAALVFSLFNATSMTMSAAKAAYNPNASLNYGKSHWDDGVGECAEFVRKCLNAGGCPVKSNGCSSMVRELKGSSFSAYGSFVQLTVQSNGYISARANDRKLSLGDPIFYYCPNETDGCPYVHTVLYSGTDSSGNVKCYAHTSPKNNETIRYTNCGYCGSKISAVYAFHFNSNSTASSTQTVTSVKTDRYYTIKNVGSGKYLNVYGSRSANNTNITVYAKDGTTGQNFKFWYNSRLGGYTMTPQCGTSRRVNVYGYSAANRSNVCTWSTTNSSTQTWIIKAVSGGYIICCADNPNYVLTATGSSNSSNVNIQQYNAGNQYQIWTSSAFA